MEMKRLFHGTTSEVLDQIKHEGIKATEHEEWEGRNTVCAMDSLEKARKVAAYFGSNGIVIEFVAPSNVVEYHPDYGSGPEFDTIHVIKDIPPTNIINIIAAPSSLSFPRPAGVPLRKWKQQEMQKDPDWHTKLDQALGLE